MIPSRFIPKIGEIAIEFSDLDREIIFSLWYLLGCGAKQGAALTSNINSPSARLKILEDLCDVSLSTEEERTSFKTLLRAVRASTEQRNKLFHDMPYFFSPSEGHVGYFKNDVVLKPRKPTLVSDQWLHELLVCVRFQAAILRRVRGAMVVEGEPWHKAEIPFPNGAK